MMALFYQTGGFPVKSQERLFPQIEEAELRHEDDYAAPHLFPRILIISLPIDMPTLSSEVQHFGKRKDLRGRTKAQALSRAIVDLVNNGTKLFWGDLQEIAFLR